MLNIFLQKPSLFQDIELKEFDKVAVSTARVDLSEDSSLNYLADLHFLEGRV